jgi:hypothetical protein
MSALSKPGAAADRALVSGVGVNSCDESPNEHSPALGFLGDDEI